jgi:hypothetical protein
MLIFSWRNLERGGRGERGEIQCYPWLFSPCPLRIAASAAFQLRLSNSKGK